MTKPITYQLAESANYHFEIAKIGNNSYDKQSYYFKEDFQDVRIGRRSVNIDIPTLENTCLWTINGYVYNTVVDTGNLYIPNGTTHMLRSRANKVGLLNFGGLTSKIKKISLRADQIHADHNQLAYQKVFISFDEPVVSPILVMAGYLVFEHPEFFYRVSDQTFALCLHRLNYMEKLYELFQYRDIFKDLGVPVSAHNPTHVDTEAVRSTETIRKFLTLSNSFVVDVGCEGGLVLDPLYLEHSTIPGAFRTSKNPTLPMFVGYGKLTEYHKAYVNDNCYTVTSQDHIRQNYLFSSNDPRNVHAYNGHRKVGSTYKLSPAFFLDVHAKTA